MALGVSVALIGDEDPQAVQVLVTGTTLGDTYTVTGSSGTLVWPVRGGTGVAAGGTQIVLVDVASPINVAVTYQAVHDSDAVTATSSPITVPFAARQLLATVDGAVNVTFTTLRDNGAPRDVSMRSATFQIPGRLLPVVRYDVPGGESGEYVVDTVGSQTDDMFALVRAGGLAIFRTDGSLRDLPAVQFILISSCPSVLTGVDSRRTWTVGFQVVADPQPDAVAIVETWDDFDSVYAASTWTAFNTEWTGQTWNLFDIEDWATR